MAGREWKSTTERLLGLGILAIGAVACGEDASGGSQEVVVEFAAKVGDEVAVCGQTYTLGSNATEAPLSYLGFYVAGVELKNADGDYVSIELDQNSFQNDNVALLDFEDGCGSLGTIETNSTVTGSVPAGSYEGLRFTMGVPFGLNHLDSATQPSPLNLPPMWWNWQGGHKFLRVDTGNFAGGDWRFHLGSTGCDGDAETGGTTSCGRPNRVEVEFEGFDSETNRVVADIGALTDGVAIDAPNQEGTAPGCQAQPMDGDCTTLFRNLGLAFGDNPAGAQSFFRME